MGSYKNEDWYIKSSIELLKEYGDIPPPWIFAPDAHPYSIQWRMGAGETHLMILWEWMSQMEPNFDARLAYLKKYPAPPCWYQWIVGFLWKVDFYEFKEADYIPYYEKLEQLGFKNTADVAKDMNRKDLK